MIYCLGMKDGVSGEAIQYIGKFHVKSDTSLSFRPQSRQSLPVLSKIPYLYHMLFISPIRDTEFLQEVCFFICAFSDMYNSY